ncbi:hypothetical protein Pint_29859 [Pistacia integerrima]|uniref:Uncharacterized protein n=1 Tax=Pistacia integerrima TaxID=434235 RepID=A0ACC0WY83_9ROSI|nr:hypothetical protein Pint_29859 [Pistacia integerrima]
MPKQLQKSLKKCLSKLKKCPSNIQLQYSSSFSTSKNWVLSSCKHPKTLSFAVYCDQNDNSSNNNNNNNDGAATLSDIDRFLYENFKSLYLNDEDDNKKNEECDGDKIPNGALFDSPRFIEPPSIRQGSHRFFVAPGFSGSLIEEARNSFTNYEDMAGSTSTSTATSTSTTALNDHSSTVSTDSKYVKLPGDSITILRYSPSPYGDFQRSMQEMVEARLQHQATVDWDFLEELLFFYVRLNEKKSYKFILRAFVDLVVGLKSSRIRFR